MRVPCRVVFNIVTREAVSDEPVLLIKLIDSEGETIDFDYLTARQMRSWLGLEHPK